MVPQICSPAPWWRDSLAMLALGSAASLNLVPHRPLSSSYAAHVPRAIPVCTSSATANEVAFPAPLSRGKKLQRAAAFSLRILPVIGSYLSVYSGIKARLGLKA